MSGFGLTISDLIFKYIVKSNSKTLYKGITVFNFVSSVFLFINKQHYKHSMCSVLVFYIDSREI
jgi:hypothetical protein